MRTFVNLTKHKQIENMKYFIFDSDAHYRNDPMVYDTDIAPEFEPFYSTIEFPFHSFPEALVRPVGYRYIGKTEPTDLLLCPLPSSLGFVMTERTLRIFDQFNIPEYRVVEFDIDYHGNDLKYLWVVFRHTFDLDQIDIPQSSFFSGNEYFSRKDLEIRSREAFDAFLLETDSLKRGYMKLVLQPSFDWDFFRIHPEFGVRYFCSEPLKQKLEEAGITGLKFTEAQRIVHNKAGGS
jgi:hypothetical protein